MSLFGAPKPAASTPFGGSLFGNTATAATTTAPTNNAGGVGAAAAGAAKPSVFGASLWDANAGRASTAPTANPLGATSLFGASTLGVGARPTAAAAASTTAATAAAAAAAARPASGAYFDSLLAKSKKRSDGDLGDAAADNLPSLHLGLGDLRQKLRKIGPTGRPSSAAADGKAHYVLAASGVDPGATVRDLGKFAATTSAAAAASSTAPAPGGGSSGGGGGGVPTTATTTIGTASEVDVDTYLANLQTKTTLSMIADGLDRSVRDFDNFLEDHVTTEWEAQRRRIYEHFGIKTRDEMGGVGATGLPRFGTPEGGSTSGAGGGGSALGGFGRSRRTRQQSTASQQQQGSTLGATGGGGGGGGSAFGRSRMRKSVIGTASRIGPHGSEFTDVETAHGDGSGGGGSGGGGSGGAGGAGGAGVGADAGSGSGGVHGSRSGGLEDRFTREKQSRLADTIHRLNDSRMEKTPFPILSEMVAVEEGLGGDRHAALVTEAFRALADMVGEDTEPVAGRGALPGAPPTRGGAGPRERSFAKAYLDSNNNSAAAVAMRQRILAGSNRFLERKFFSEVEAQIAKFPQEASLGGRPDVVSKIKAYIRVRSAQKMLVPDNVELQQVQGEYVWAVVFYLLRSGHVTEAAQYVNDHQTQIRGIDRVFASYINSYASSEDRRLKRAMQERCNSDYTQRARNAPEGSVDPFRMACYKVIGRCDVGNRSLDNLQTDVHDWIWLQFNLAREGDRAAELASEMYGLAELQTTVREIGQKHFAAGAAGVASGAYAMYFYLQVLAGLYEPAVAYLYGFSYVDAVHFAVALVYYGLLRTPDAQVAAESEQLLSHTTRGQPQINLPRMVGYYTRDFRAANVGAAVDYLVLLCMDVDPSSSASADDNSALCYEALRELVLETREFSKLIGDIRPDGTRIRGLLEAREPLFVFGEAANNNLVKTITLQAARDADGNGRTTDAVLLYHLAGDYDTVVVLVSRALSEAIALDIGEEPLKLLPVKPRSATDSNESLSLAAMDDPIALARAMMTMYERDNMFRRRIRDANRLACNVLLQMSDIKALVEARKWPQCLDKIRTLEILPLEASGDPSVIRAYAARFPSLAQPVAINIPNLLLWTVLACTQQRDRLLAGHFSGNESASRMLADELKQICVDLTAYTSQLRYRFPPYLHEALARASAD